MIKELQKQVAELRDRVVSLSAMTIEGYNRLSSRGGVSFAKGTRDNAPHWSDKTVVIVVKPVEGDRTLTVREAGYLHLPPKPCTGDGESATCDYRWLGETFEVYPPLGMKAIEFDGDENTDEVTTPPKLTSKFHRIHREHNSWVVNAPSKGGAGIDVAIVIGVASNSASVKRVKLVIPPPPALPTYETTGPQLLVRAWPGTDSAFWSRFVNATTDANTMYVLLVTIDGIEYVYPTWAINTFSPSPALPAGDCI